MAAVRSRLKRHNEIKEFFQDTGKRVVSFAGFAELGYQDPSVIENVLGEVLEAFGPGDVIVNSGTLLRTGGEDGIALVYPWAKQRGFETSGIHPSVALRHAATHTVSPLADHVFFVEDSGWGGLYDGRPSPTLEVILDVSDELVVIGGGKHAAEELLAFVAAGKAVRYFSALMNPDATAAWAGRSGVVIEDLKGAAFETWRQLTAYRNESRS